MIQNKFKFTLLYYFKGGWLSASCPHKIVYALKFVIRAEGPRDYVDVLLSLNYQPNVVLIDMAHMVAAHGNLRKPGMFGPFQGRVAPATPENIKAAQEGCLKVDWPWLLDSYSEQSMDTRTAVMSDHNYLAPVHPLTGKQTCKYILCTPDNLLICRFK